MSMVTDEGLYWVGAGAAGTGALTCLCLPDLVDALFEPFLQRDGGRPRQDPPIPPAHLRWLLAGPLALGVLLDMSKGSRTALVPLAHWLALMMLRKPNYETLDRILLLLTFVGLPACSLAQQLSPESLAIGWRGSEGETLSSWHYVPVLILNWMACLLYSRISRVLAVSLAVNAVILCANPTMHRISIPLTLVCTAVAGLKASYSQQLQISRLILIGWAVVLALMLATNMAELYPNIHMFIVQNADAGPALGRAAAFGAAVLCLVCPDAVNTMLEPILGTRMKDTEQRDLSVRAFFWVLATWLPILGAYYWCTVPPTAQTESAGRYMKQEITTCAAVIIFVVLMRVERTYTNYDMLLRFIVLGLCSLFRILEHFELQNKGVYKIGIAVLPLVHMALYSSHAEPLGQLLFFTGLVCTWTEHLHEILLSALLALLTSLVIAAKVIILQNLALIRKQERRDDQDKIRKQCCHRLNSPLAALDLEARMLEADEAVTPGLAKKMASIRACMGAVLESLDALKNQFDEDPVEHAHDEQPDAKPPKVLRRPGRSVQSLGQGTPVTVMVVDDIKCLRQVQVRHLKGLATRWDQDIEVVEAATGEECLIRVADPRARKIHAVMIDQHMQDAGGQLLGSEATSKLRQCGFAGLIIGWSGNAESKPLFMHAGADDFWLKPIPPDEAMVQLFESKLGLSRCALPGQHPMQQDDPAASNPSRKWTARNHQQRQSHFDHLNDTGMAVEEWRDFVMRCVLPEYEEAMQDFRAAPSKDQAHKLKNIAGVLFLCDAHYEACALERLCLEQDNLSHTATLDRDSMRIHEDVNVRASRLDSLMRHSIQSLLERPGPPGYQDSVKFKDYLMQSRSTTNCTTSDQGTSNPETQRKRTTIGMKLARKHGFVFSPIVPKQAPRGQ